MEVDPQENSHPLTQEEFSRLNSVQQAQFLASDDTARQSAAAILRAQWGRTTPLPRAEPSGSTNPDMSQYLTFMSNMSAKIDDLAAKLANLEPKGKEPAGEAKPNEVPRNPSSDHDQYAGQFARLCNRPEVFEGKRATTQNFLHQIRLYFAANSMLFDTDRRKVDYALMLLRGTAGDWAQPLVERRFRHESKADPTSTMPEELSTWEAFEKAIMAHWGLVNEEERAAEAILEITQGASKKVSDYTTRFMTYRNKLPQWHESTLTVLYFKGLKFGLQKALLNSWGTEANKPKTVALMAQQALEHEGLFEGHHRRQEASTNHGSSQQSSSQNAPNHQVAANDSDTMQIDYVKRLGETERNRRFKHNLCFKCGRQGHKARNCTSEDVNTRQGPKKRKHNKKNKPEEEKGKD